MSIIKSQDENLTLNAHGSGNDIKFQSNGVEKASISSAGAFTSTTIDATALTGNLPALNASALTNLDAADVSGTHTNFTSTGIDDNADATAMTITSDEQVGIGVTDPDSTLEVSNNTSTYTTHIASTKNATGDNALAITTYDENASNTSYMIRCTTNTNVAGAGTDRFAVMSDGRGLSQFTAKCWVNFVGHSTVSINDSHNVSSITDNGTGNYSINFSNNLAHNSYSVASMSQAYSQYGNYSDSFGTFNAAWFKVEHREGGSYTDAQKFCANVFGD